MLFGLIQRFTREEITYLLRALTAKKFLLKITDLKLQHKN